MRSPSGWQSRGATVCAVGRRGAALEATAARGAGAERFEIYEADLVVDEQVTRLAEALVAREGGVDVLVHGAGTIALGDLESARSRTWTGSTRRTSGRRTC